MDSKISQLPSANKIYDHDLLVAVTGYNVEGSYPDNVKISFDRIRKDIVRLHEMIFMLSGFSGYYNTGDNTITITSHQVEGNLINLTYGSGYPYMQSISTTGLNARNGNLTRIDFDGLWPYSGIISQTGINAIKGNLIDIQFSKESLAASGMHNRSGPWYSNFNKDTNLGQNYYSGIISVTGINFLTENLIGIDIDSIWPHSGTIYSTGLNAVIGNNIDITFSQNHPASTKYGKTGAKYFSGIISTTGLNAYGTNLIKVDFGNNWPYSGDISTTGLNAIAGNNIEIQFSTNSAAHSGYGGAGSNYYSGIISTTGLNATASTGVYLKTNSSWPYSHEIGILEKIYEISNTYTVPTGSTSLDEYLLFPLVFPSNIKSLTYSKWKCEGYYKNISLTTYIPEIQPTNTGPLGEPVSWSSYSVDHISQGYIIPALFNFTYLLSNNTIKTYNIPNYDYSDVRITTNHNNIGSKSRSIDNAHFLAFFDIQNITSGYSTPSGGLGFILSSPWFEPPVATLNWNGTYYVDGTGYSTSASVNSTGYVTNISITGHRFFEIKAV